MMNYQTFFFELAEELQVISPESYQHTRVGLIKPSSQKGGLIDYSQKDLLSVLTGQLSHFIYLYYHLKGKVELDHLKSDDFEDLTPIVMREHQELGRKLREANRGEGYADPGWNVLCTKGDHIEVMKNGIRLSAQQSEIFSSNWPPKPEAAVSLRFPKDMPYANPGYYTAIGNEGPPNSLLGSIVRVYFNVFPSGAPYLLSLLTMRLNNLHLKFFLKVLNHPNAYPRSDSAVLYIQGKDFLCFREMLAEIGTTLRMSLQSPISSFTKLLTLGVAIAEEPKQEISRYMSFGQHRSMLVARGIVKAFVDGGDTPERRYDGIVHEFSVEGLDISKPYLNSESVDLYHAFGNQTEG